MVGGRSGKRVVYKMANNCVVSHRLWRDSSEWYFSNLLCHLPLSVSIDRPPSIDSTKPQVHGGSKTARIRERRMRGRGFNEENKTAMPSMPRERRMRRRELPKNAKNTIAKIQRGFHRRYEMLGAFRQRSHYLPD